jgi:hypothetical protein
MSYSGGRDTPDILDRPHRALRLPDILLCVFELLKTDKKTLCNAMGVNYSWASAASRFLWDTPPLDALLHIEDRHRRQFYANGVLSIFMPSKPTLPSSVVEGIAFPRLWALMLPSLPPISHLKCFLQPSLAAIHLPGCLPPELGSLVTELCPRLQRVSICSQARYGDDERAKNELRALLGFFQRCTLPLTAVVLIGFWPDSADYRAVFQHLARRAMLAYLDITSSGVEGANCFFRLLKTAATLETDSVGPLQRERGGGCEVAAPFHDLRQLRINTSAQHMKHLSRAAPFLTALQLSATDGDCASVFMALTPFSTLTRLSVTFVVHVVLLTDDSMYALQQLQSLRSLSITGADASPAMALTDDSFGATVQCLPHLQHLDLTLGRGPLGLTGAALRTLGQRCRHLEVLDMLGTWDLSCWRDITSMLLFPELKFFRLDEAIMQPAGAAYDK